MKKLITLSLVLLLCSSTLLTSCRSTGSIPNTSDQSSQTTTEEVPQLPDSTGLEYFVNFDQKSCTIKGIGTCTDTTVVIPEVIDGYTVTAIGNATFSEQRDMVGIVIPKSVESIGSLPLWGCLNLTSITVEKGNPVYHSSGNCLIETKSKKLLAGCHNSVIPADGSVTTIGQTAFGRCYRLTSIEIPETITEIESDAFSNCGALTSISIPKSVSVIKDGTFFSCESLKTIRFCEGVTEIEDGAFRGCSAVSQIDIPASLTKIAEGSLGYGDFLEKINVSKDNPRYYIAGNSLIDKETKTLLLGTSKSIIPEDGSVTRIAEYAFCKRRLTTIKIPQSVTEIGENAFSYCSMLTEISLPDGIAELPINALLYCTKLENITLPNTLKKIEKFALHGSKALKNVYFNGTAAEWESIEIGTDNEPLSTATIYYYSETQPTTSGNYWHYVDGVPTVW